MSPMHCLVVGGGIGGPVAAIALAKNGHKVTLLECSETKQGVGYAFRLTPNSDRILKRLGIDAEAGGAVAANVVRKFDAQGNPQNEVRENQNAQQARQAKSVFATRHQLGAQLMDLAVQSGVEARLGNAVVRVDLESTSAELDDGTRVSADVIIAADGVKSVVRSEIADPATHFPHSSTGHNAFRFMLDKDDVLKDGVTASAFQQEPRMFMWTGDSKLILAYPADYDRQLNVVCTHPETLSDQATTDADGAGYQGYDRKVSREVALDIYREFDPIARRLVELADPDGLRIWKLRDMDEIPSWSKNCTALIGDACHPVLPFSFSGASMAIEDAITVATLLPAGTELADIPGRLALYEEIRRPRVARVRQAGRDIAYGTQGPEYLATYMRFLVTHDAAQTAQEALEGYLLKSNRNVAGNTETSEGSQDTGSKGGSDRGAKAPGRSRSCCVVL
ncbi:FAD/NAD(P)-binding domain-containing protein [Thozetella sp. PMI_491]|nr:FAD/NAD(P)-binding domain-containing protein [Thozetella sp. PMI_491]